MLQSLRAAAAHFVVCSLLFAGRGGDHADPYTNSEDAAKSYATFRRNMLLVAAMRATTVLLGLVSLAYVARPEQIRVPLFAARTLNTTGQYRVTLSLR